MFYFAFEQRNVGDYKYVLDFPEKLSERIINNAKDFLDVTRKYLENFINE